MNGSSSIILTNLSHDTGFVVELGEADGCWRSPCRGADFKLWLRGQSAASAPYLAWYRGHVFRDDDLPEMTQDP